MKLSQECLQTTQPQYQQSSQTTTNLKKIKPTYRNLYKPVIPISQMPSNCPFFTALLREPQKVFQLFSGAHKKFKLKFHTLFLSHHLFLCSTAKEDLESICLEYHCLVALFVAMKYQEIYPPNLKQVMKYLGIKITLKNYLMIEVRILKAMKVQLDVCTLDRKLIQKIHKKVIEQRIWHFYLEISMSSKKIFNKFAECDILEAIMGLVLNEVSQSHKVQLIAKYLLLQKQIHEEKQSILYMKYHMKLQLTDKCSDQQ